MQRLAERFARLRARLEAGTLRPPRARGETDDEAAPEARPRVRVRRPWLPFLPRTFGWFARTVPGAGPAAREFEMLLASPGMPALISVAPQAGRILRPLESRGDEPARAEGGTVDSRRSDGVVLLVLRGGAVGGDYRWW
jgi:hypothetical protein